MKNAGHLLDYQIAAFTPLIRCAHGVNARIFHFPDSRPGFCCAKP